MVRIDSHQHFWKYDPRRQSWMTEEMARLKKDHGPAELAECLGRCGLDGSVAVQASQTEEENVYLVELAEKNSFIRGIVGWTDLQSDALSERLSFWSDFAAIKGFRHVLHDEPDVDFMLRPAFQRGIGTLQRFGYTYDLLVFPVHLPRALELVRKFPDQRFVIDHLAKPRIREQEIAGWKKQLEPLAALPNVYCKISGMVTESIWCRWKQEDFVPYLDAVTTLFGTKRIMYGSDWPVCTLSASYEEAYGIVKSYFEPFSAAEKDDFFGMNATRFYGL